MSKLPKALRVKYSLKPKGLALKANKHQFHLTYPDDIWKSYPKTHKNFLLDNLIYLLTVNVPFVSGFEKIKYENISYPYLKPLISKEKREYMRADGVFKSGGVKGIGLIGALKTTLQFHIIRFF